MPYEGPGERFDAIATKDTLHGAPAVEKNHAGIAAKTQQPSFVIADPTDSALVTAAKTIKASTSEPFIIFMDGVHEVAVSLLPGGADEGDPLWIDPADNTLKAATGAGLVKFGVISHIDVTLGRALVNLEQRGSF